MRAGAGMARGRRKGSVYAEPDILRWWEFDGATDAIKSGPFKTTAGGTTFLDHTPTSSVWAADAGSILSGVNCVRQDYPSAATNTGYGFTYDVTNPTAGPLYFYCKFAQSNPFNFNGTKSNADNLKWVRFYKAGYSGASYLSFLIISGAGTTAVSRAYWDRWGSFNEGAKSGTFDWNAHLGESHDVEMMVDFSTPTACTARLWIDGVLDIDTTYDFSTQVVVGTDRVGEILVCSVANSMGTASAVYVDAVALSSRRIGP